MRKAAFSILAVLLQVTILSAQESKYFVNAAYETNTSYYVDDEANSAVAPDKPVGSNNYLIVEFGNSLWQAGLQGEAYLPGLMDYPSEYDGWALSMKYVQFSAGGFAVRAGDFFDQLGSGLLFRAYEERSLGVNTALLGGQLAFNRWDKLHLRAFAGVPKQFLGYCGDVAVAGADASLDVSALAGIEGWRFALEGSALLKHQALENDAERNSGVDPDIFGTSARALFEWEGLQLKGEWVQRDADVATHNDFCRSRSGALLAEVSYTAGGFGANLTFRRLRNMSMQSDRTQTRMYTLLNYIPSLTQQHEYSLAALNPYRCMTEGETGGQADFYAFVPRGSKIGGRKGMRVHGNFSTYSGPISGFGCEGNQLYYRDLTLDAERWWGKKLKTKLLYTWQTYNNRIGTHMSDETWVSHVIVADATYKFNPKHALRGEYQLLFSQFDQGNWLAGALEYSIAPGWSFSAADMWNYGYSRTHYFNGGVAWSHSSIRMALNFGRFREGYQCAGGICRLVPAYSGVNFTLTASY